MGEHQHLLRAWRARLLAMLVTLEVPVCLFTLPLCLFPRPVPGYLVGWTVFVGFCLCSVALNRQGKIRSACLLFLLGQISACAVSLFSVPSEYILTNYLIDVLFACNIMQSGFLLGRRVPYGVAGICVALIALHTLYRLDMLVQVTGLRAEAQALWTLFPMLVLTKIAYLTQIQAKYIEETVSRADVLTQEQEHFTLRAGDLLEMNAELISVHTRLETRNGELEAVQKELEERNLQLLRVQAELEAQYRAQEERARQLEALATIDGMTGLANHRAFHEELQRQAARAQRHQTPLSLVLFDVDHFKKYNDAFGHPAGDEVLRTVGTLLKSTVREGDFPARYGGEEFAVILHDQDAQAAQVVAERIRAAIEQHTFAHRAITISAGVAEYCASEPIDVLIQRADVGLYESKSAGRNRVTCISRTEERVAGSQDHWYADFEAKTKPSSEAENAERTADAPEIDLPALRNTLEEQETAWSCSTYGGLTGLLQEPVEPTLAALLDILERRNVEMPGHSERLARYALTLAQELSRYYESQRASRPLLPYLTPGDLKALAFGALLHDIGKISISEAILRKAGKLTEDEWRQIRRHPLVGARLVAGYASLEAALPVVRYHHERWDGSGYPQGLVGEAIPLTARIFAVCDTFEVMTTDQSYRKRLDYLTARQEIERGSGTQFDPDVVAAFLALPEEVWQLREIPSCPSHSAVSLSHAA